MAEISKTANQTLMILEKVAELGPVSIVALVRHLGVNRTIVTRGLETLRSRGYIRRSPEGFVLGPMLLSLSKKTQAGLAASAEPVLHRLAETHGQTFILSMRDGDETVQVAQAMRSSLMVRLELSGGYRHPLHLGASGQAILAFLDTGSIDRQLKDVSDPQALKKRLKRIREIGYAQSNEELGTGIQGISVPLTIQDEVIGSVGVVAPIEETDALFSAIPELQNAANEIAATVTENQSAPQRTSAPLSD